MKKLEKAEGSDANWQTDRGGASCSVLLDKIMIHFIYGCRLEMVFSFLSLGLLSHRSSGSMVCMSSDVLLLCPR